VCAINLIELDDNRHSSVARTSLAHFSEAGLRSLGRLLPEGAESLHIRHSLHELVALPHLRIKHRHLSVGCPEVVATLVHLLLRSIAWS